MYVEEIEWIYIYVIWKRYIKGCYVLIFSLFKSKDEMV